MADKTLRYNVEVNSGYALQEFNDLYQAAINGSTKAQNEINSKLGGTVTTVLDWEVRVNEKNVDGVLTKTKEMVPVTKAVLSEWEKLRNKHEQVNKTQEGSLSSMRQQLNAAKQLRDGIAKTVVTINDQGKAVKVTNQAWIDADAQVRNIGANIAKMEGNWFGVAKAQYPIIGNILSMGNALTQIAQIAETIAIAFQQISAAAEVFIQRTKQIEQIRLAMGGFLKDQEAISSVLSSSKNISLTYGASLTQVEQAYKRLTPSIIASGGSLSDTEAVITALAAKTTQLGLNTEQSGRYIEAFAQVMGKGKLQSEELNQQFSELDGALRSQIASYLASAHGITDLEEAMKNGEVTANLFREAFVAISAEASGRLAGDLGAIQQRIQTLGQEGGITVQQLENFRNTLNTISVESLADTFSGLGKSFESIKTAFSQFFVAVTTNLPNIKSQFKLLFDVIGQTLQLLVVGFLNGVMVLAKGFDTLLGVMLVILNPFKQLVDLLRNVPGFDVLIQGVEQFGQALMNNFAQGTDIILGMGESVDVSKAKIEQQNQSIDRLKTLWEAGLISADEYKAGLEAQKTKLEEIKTAAEERYEAEKTTLEELKEKVNERYDAENEKLEEQKGKLEEKIQAEKDATAEVLENLKDAYEQRKSLIDQETEQIKSRYDAELAAINAQTPAQAALVELRKKKLQNIIASAEATEEEKLQAQAQLDTMRQQEESAELRKRKEEELAAQAEKKAEADRQYQAEVKQAEEERDARINKFQEAVDSLNELLSTNKERQKEINEQINEALGLNEEVYETLDDINGAVDKQVRKVNEAKGAYEQAKNTAAALANEIERAAKAQERLNEARRNKPGGNNNEQRFAGGPVSGGTKYTVNELGKEGFLSASGQLSAINVPSWGEWRAPSSGTVIPADVFASIKAAQASSSRSGAPLAVSRVNDSGTFAGMLRGLMGGSNDTITNNVTIQAANTTKAASDILVELTKIRRRRYS